MAAQLNRRAPEWAAAAGFLGAYLHQDFDAEYAQPWDAVLDFKAGTAPNVQAEAATGLRRLVTSFVDDSDLEKAATSLGMAYHPPTDGTSYRDWLSAVAAFLENPEAHPGPPERDSPSA